MIKFLLPLFLYPSLAFSQQIINQKQNGEPVEIYAEKELNGIKMITNI